ncbi:hypothetical protein GZH46_02240, partial [Fragariocoptes setiger]
MILQEIGPKITYCRGATNHEADCLSRASYATESDQELDRMIINAISVEQDTEWQRACQADPEYAHLVNAGSSQWRLSGDTLKDKKGRIWVPHERREELI